MKRNDALYIVLLLLVAAGFYFYFKTKETTYISVTNYEQCVAAGYERINTYPEQCKTPDNRIFANSNNVVNTPVATTTASTSTNQTSTTTPPTATSTNSTSTSTSNLIIPDTKPNTLVKSPATFTGKARGSWYFEASFPVEIKDANGKTIAQGAAQAQGEWMTTQFVPYKITLTFTNPTTATGTLILHKDNPSGDPARDQSVSIPIRFK